VAVEKLAFLPKQPKLGDRKCLGEPRKSFIRHPDAILFSRISREGVFQQPRLTTIVTAEVASFKLVAEDKVAIEVGRSVKKENSY
jgi:hypothetical protein